MKKIIAGTSAIALSLSMTSVALAATSNQGQNISVTVTETIGLSCDAAIDIDNSGTLTANSPVSNSTDCEVTTNSQTGYILALSDDRGASNALYHNIQSGTADGQITDLPAWDGTAGSTNAWVNGTTKGLGFSVYAAPTKDVAWGTGTSCHDANNEYAGLPDADVTIMEHDAYSNALTTTSVCYRVDVPTTQISGEYSGSVTYTATTTP